jgi:hypothetical protein
MAIAETAGAPVMNRKQTSATPAESAPLTPGKLPLEAEVRANDLEADESTAPEEARDMADDEAQPGKGENAPGFLKRRKS